MIRSLAVALAILLAGLRVEALTTEALLDTLQHTAFDYFWQQANVSNGLVKDRSTAGSPSSIAAVGFGLSAICIGIDHGYVTRNDGRARVLTTLQNLWTQPQGSGATGTIGYKGLYYHFLDMTTSKRTWDSELSTIDTALLFAGVIDAKQYFTTADPLDIQVRSLADSIYYRADWEFMRNLSNGIFMGWKPGTGFQGFGRWIGYNEAMILYILALGSPTHPVPTFTWASWTAGYQWQTHFGYTYVVFAPLFGHQYSHCWIDFRYIQDSYMQSHGITYWENSRRATMAQRAYCINNLWMRVGYGPNFWGLTPSDGPGGYLARGAPPSQNDDGTIAPTGPAGSIAFAPAVAIPTLHHIYDTYGAQLWGPYGFKDAINPTFNWVATDYLGIDEGPIVVMIENYRNQKVWNRFMQNADIQRGLERAGFVPAPNVGSEPTPEVIDAMGSMTTYPNPIRRAGTVSFQLPLRGRVQLVLHDVSGRQVREVLDAELGAGRHVVPLDAAGLANGVYSCTMKYEGSRSTRRLTVLR